MLAQGETLVQTDAAVVQSPSVSPSAGDIGSPPASRLRRARWLDPRLITGILLVLGSVIVGTRVIAAADQTLPVLVAATDLAPGQALSAELVETRNVMLDGNLDRYISGPIGDGYVVVRAVGEGELLPRSSVAPATEDGELRYVTIPLPAAEVPVNMNRGAVVDVWRIPPVDAADRIAERLLTGVGVTDSDSGEGGLANAGGQARVTLAVAAADVGRSPAEQNEAIGALVTAARDGLVYLTVIPEAPQ